jgi:hypothetical protein
MECRALLWGSLMSAIASLLALRGTTIRHAEAQAAATVTGNFSTERRKGPILTAGSKSVVEFQNLIAVLQERI